MPEAVREALAMPLEDEDFCRELGQLNRLLSRDRDVKEFVTGFNAVFRRCVRGFAAKHGIGEANPLEERCLLELAVKHGIIDDGTQSRYYPDLDYIANFEPENSFRYVL